MKRISLLAAVLLVIGLLAGCGGSDSSTADAAPAGPPADAAVEDFCGAFLDLIQQVQAAGQDISNADRVKLAKDLAGKLSDVGTPADMPADARRAFELAIQKINDLPDDADAAEMDKSAGELSEAEQKDQAALTTYLTKTCASQLNPSSSPS